MTINEQYESFMITDELRAKFDSMEKEYVQCSIDNNVTNPVIITTDKTVNYNRRKINA